MRAFHRLAEAARAPEMNWYPSLTIRLSQGPAPAVYTPYAWSRYSYLSDRDVAQFIRICR